VAFRVQHNFQASISSPYFWTIVSNFNAIPLGCLSPKTFLRAKENPAEAGLCRLFP
jgi:hypothetical protein